MRVALVEFLNAIPLYYALKKKIINNDMNFISASPSICANLLRNSEVSMGNVPIVEYTKSNKYKLLPEACISSNRRVKSVIFILKKPIRYVKKVKLDANSNTSVALTKVLFKFKYGINVDYVYEGDADCELSIGDKALKKLLEKPYGEIIDLAAEWREMTSLPFVFATWVTNRNISKNTVDLFIDAKDWGKTHISEICRNFCKNSSLLSLEECENYLKNNISYDLNAEKIKSIKLFFDYAEKCGAIKNSPNLRFL